MRARAWVALASVVLVSCGGRYSAPAAHVDGRQILVSDIERVVDLVRAIQPGLDETFAAPGGDERRKEVTRSVLVFLIQNVFVLRYAEARGISVQPGDLAQVTAQIEASAGGADVLDRNLTTLGLDREDVRYLAEAQVLAIAVGNAVVLERLGSLEAPLQDQSRVFREWLAGQVEGSDVEVSPRFGRLDPLNGTISPLSSTAELG